MAWSMCKGIVDLDFKSKEKVFKHPNSVKTLYENYFLLAPDGKFLAIINQNTANWYVQEKLGYFDCLEPSSVRLYFQSRSGTSLALSEDYSSLNQNVCVICGSYEILVPKMVVQQDYRRRFPVELRTHTSHDVVFLCLQCHRSVKRADDIL